MCHYANNANIGESLIRQRCLCGGEDSTSLFKYDLKQNYSSVVLCNTCGLVYQSPTYTNDYLNKYYKSGEYRKDFDNKENIEEKFYSEPGREIFDSLYPYLNRYKNRKESILEIGCGAGWNLIQFFKTGFHVTGIDLDKKMIDLGRRHGLNLHYGGINRLSKKYDIIILNHVLEHLDKPIQSLRLLKRYLTSHGVIYIAVPNFDNATTGSLQFVHKWYFTLNTFLYYLSREFTIYDYGSAENIHMFAIMSNSGQQRFSFDINKEKRKIKRKAFYVRLKQKIKFTLEGRK